MVLELEQKIRLQEIGAIKIGNKGEERTSQGGNTYRLPQKLDYFLIVTKEKDAGGNFVPNEKIMKRLGEHPTALDIMLLYDDIDLNFYTFYGLYKGRKCLCHGDGRMAIRRKKDGSQEEIVCDRNNCKFSKKDENGNQQCKLNGILQVLLKESNIVGGVHIFRTTGWNSCSNLIASMLLIQNITGGMLAGIPLKMTLQPKSVLPEGSNSYRTVYVVNIIYPQSQEKLLETAVEIAKRRMTAGVELRKIHQKAKLISAPLEESDDAARDVVEEFYPEAQDQFVEYIEDDTSASLIKKDDEEPEIVENFDDGDFSEEENQNGKNNGNNNVKNNGGQQEDLLVDGVI